MRFLADMGVASSVVRALRDMGHDALHVRECLSPTSADNVILDYAHEENRIIMTMDHDFGDLIYLRGSSAPSLIFFRVSDEKPQSIMAKMAVVLRDFEEVLLSGAIITVEDDRVRYRQLPIK